MTSTRRPTQAGQWLTGVGAGILVLAAALLVPGIDAFNRATYGGGDAAEALTLLGPGAAALLAGAAVLIAGRRRSAAEMRRPRTYADRHENHTLPAEDRPTNPNDTSLRGYQEGI